jgi:putative chitinase
MSTVGWQFEFDADRLAQCARRNKNIAALYEALEAVLPRYEINTAERVAHFLAQCGHESVDFTTLKENLNYSAEQLHRVWPSRFPTVESAQPYNRNPEAIANKVYSSRMGNGHETSGEGFRYRGRGAIQLTGKDNYKAFAESINYSLDQAVEYLETLQGAIESAAWFWWRHNLNALADQNDVARITKIINGGTLGLEERRSHTEHNLQVLGGSVAAQPAADTSTAGWPTLRQGSPHHEWVQRLQECLGLTADGNFGPGTDAALRQWQTANGLTADGIAGPQTLKKLFG